MAPRMTLHRVLWPGRPKNILDRRTAITVAKIFEERAVVRLKKSLKKN